MIVSMARDLAFTDLVREIDDKRRWVFSTPWLVGDGDDRLMQFLLVEFRDHRHLLCIQSHVTMDRIDTDSSQ